ncbi:MAG: hypothetical protein ACLFPL_01125 [Candidatus Nanoarchaeia archaeon]
MFLVNAKNPQDALEVGFYMPELKKLLKLYDKNNYSFRKYSNKYQKYLKNLERLSLLNLPINILMDIT